MKMTSHARLGKRITGLYEENKQLWLLVEQCAVLHGLDKKGRPCQCALCRDFWKLRDETNRKRDKERHARRAALKKIIKKRGEHE